MKNLPEGMVEDRDNVVYYEILHLKLLITVTAYTSAQTL